jgi:hypothetical protein
MAWWGPLVLGSFALIWFATQSGRRGLLWGPIFLAATVLVLAIRRRVSPTEVMALQVLAIALLSDYLQARDWQRDLHIYLTAGANFIHNLPVYTTEPLHATPKSGVEFLPFLYAPPTLPLFGLMAEVPRRVMDVVWVVASVAAVVASLRAFGLSWRWALLALLWTPIEQGLYSGNVVIPSLLLLAAATRVGGGLVLGPVLKPQNGIVSLWLVRERAWRALGAGLLALLLLVAATLPLTGTDLWRNWIEGLVALQGSMQYSPGLYGVGLGRYLPLWAFAAVAAFTLVAALWAGGREGLARLGLASVVASPALYIHGFVFAIPAFLRLRADWFWLVAGLTAIGRWPGPELALGVGVAAWFLKGMALGPGAEQATETATDGSTRRPLHPLGDALEPWPSATSARGDAS